MMRFNLQEGFPLVTTKKVFTKGIIHELLWFLNGDTNIKYLVDNGVSIWTDWPLKNYNLFRKREGMVQVSMEWFEDTIRTDEEFAERWGHLGPVYGKQWTDFGMSRVNQIKEALAILKARPDDRGIIVTAWNPEDIHRVSLRWCHCLFQLLVINGKLSLEIYQRSCDSFLGLPFNIASYALLCHMFAQQADLEVGDLIWVGGDVHLYLNHIEQAELQLSRGPKPLPTLKLNKAPSMFDYTFDDIEIVGYESWGAIKAEVAV
jgi:thymidylate synthase